MGKEAPLYNDKDFKSLKTVKDDHFGECKLLENKQTGFLVAEIIQSFQK